MKTFLRTVFSLAAIVSSVGLGGALAQNYPNRPVRIIVPYETGGGVDLSARLIAQEMTEQTKNPVVVENKPGISGISGSTTVAEARPDGYTLLFAADTTTSAPYLLPNITFDPVRDLTPVSKIAFSPFIIVVNSKVAAANPKELVEIIKQQPDKFVWGMGGIGTPGHFAIEKFNRRTGINPLRVPYKGNGPANTALMSGEVQGMFSTLAAAQGGIQAGALKVLGIASLEPVASSPGLPTVASFGFPGFEAGSWFGLWGPKDMPPELTAQIANAVAAAIKAPEVQRKMLAAGISPAVSKNPQEFTQFVNSEVESNRTLIKELNIRLDQ